MEQIFFKNEREELQTILRNHAQGLLDIPTELENMMLDEATELVKREYDHSEGARELDILIKKYERGYGEKNILELAHFD